MKKRTLLPAFDLKKALSLLLVLTLICSISGCDTLYTDQSESGQTSSTTVTTTVKSESGNQNDPEGDASTGKDVIDLSELPVYSGSPFIVINNNQPEFNESELTTAGYEKYSSLDILGRCGVAIASCGKEIMPSEDEERGSISSVKPSGWVQAQYDFVSGKYLYNRCHLIGWQLSAENANKSNLITGTRYMNTEGMLPFENMVADYIRETDNHVAYRITPIYSGDELVCRGVQMEAYSIEDEGEGICFNVYCFNVQPGVDINYATGSSTPADSTESTPDAENGESAQSYVLNTSSKKIHLPDCSSVSNISPSNKKDHTGDIDPLLESGYSLCGSCLD